MTTSNTFPQVKMLDKKIEAIAHMDTQGSGLMTNSVTPKVVNIMFSKQIRAIDPVAIKSALASCVA